MGASEALTSGDLGFVGRYGPGGQAAVSLFGKLVLVLDVDYTTSHFTSLQSQWF
jgi:hypothetical protein